MGLTRTRRGCRIVEPFSAMLWFFVLCIRCPIPTANGQVFNPGCLLPFEQAKQVHRVDQLCTSAEGTDSREQNRIQNRVKNNFCAKGPPVTVSVETFALLQNAVDKKQIPAGTIQAVPADRSALTNIGRNSSGVLLGEGSLVRVSAYIVSAHYSNLGRGETVNCRAPGQEDNDIHINLGTNEDADPCSTVTAEMSPHFRPRAWSQVVEARFARPVRVTGQLFFDASHRPCRAGERPHGHPARSSTWEIHPVYQVDVCKAQAMQGCRADDESVWVRIEDWLDTTSLPVKLGLQVSSATVEVGKEVRVQVVLLNADNELTRAPKDLLVNVEFRISPGRSEQRSLTIHSGQSAASVNYAPSEAGVLGIRATQKELLEGGAFVIVKTPYRKTSSYSSRSARLLEVALRKAVSSTGTTSPADSPRIAFRSSPEREILANGIDAVTIDAFLIGDPLSEDMRITLHSTLGTPEPEGGEISIPRGQNHGKVIFRSTQAGTAHVEFINDTANIPVEGERAFDIQFGPPITKLELRASPPIISLAATSDLLVSLEDDHGTSYAPTQNRHIYFRIDSGEGEFEQNEVTIAAPDSLGRVRFIPTWHGDVLVTASTDHLLEVHSPIRVRIPTPMLLLSALGGCIGGLIAFLTARARWWRIIIGLVTGFVLYWAFLVGVFHTLARGFVLNPLSTIALSILGGWLGTAAFTRILHLLGVPDV